MALIRRLREAGLGLLGVNGHRADERIEERGREIEQYEEALRRRMLSDMRDVGRRKEGE